VATRWRGHLDRLRLAADIARDGEREPIQVYEGRILEGLPTGVATHLCKFAKSGTEQKKRTICERLSGATPPARAHSCLGPPDLHKMCLFLSLSRSTKHAPFRISFRVSLNPVGFDRSSTACAGWTATVCSTEYCSHPWRAGPSVID
jgi:hypothetical protein